jgi:hypothetical protein
MVDLLARSESPFDQSRKIDIMQQDPSRAHQAMNLQHVDQRPRMLMIAIDESERQIALLDELRAVRGIPERMHRDQIAHSRRHQIDRESHRLVRIHRILSVLVDRMMGAATTQTCSSSRKEIVFAMTAAEKPEAVPISIINAGRRMLATAPAKRRSGGDSMPKGKRPGVAT